MQIYTGRELRRIFGIPTSEIANTILENHPDPQTSMRTIQRKVIAILNGAIYGDSDEQNSLLNHLPEHYQSRFAMTLGEVEPFLTQVLENTNIHLS